MHTSGKETGVTASSSFKCDVCLKQFLSEAELSFHKEIEHVRHLPISGVA